MRRLLIGALLAVGLMLPTAAEASWVSNAWTSPTRNIRCVYNGYQQALTCATGTPRRSITLWSDGSTSRGRRALPARGPVLAYGVQWSSYYEDILCDSWKSGIQCYANYGGFFISRERVSDLVTRIRMIKIRAKDVALGMQCIFEGDSTVWTVTGSRRTKDGIVFTLACDKRGYKGKATTKPLDYEYDEITRVDEVA